MNTLRITMQDFNFLRETLLDQAPLEMAAFLIAGYFEDNQGHHFVVRDVMVPMGNDFDVQEDLRLQVSPIYFNKVISRAEASGLTVVMAHSHPFAQGKINYSYSDDYGETISSKTLYDCLENKPSASLLFGKDCVIGRVWNGSIHKPEPIHQIRITGSPVHIINCQNIDRMKSKDLEIFDRHIAIYGKEGQNFLSHLRVGIVGVGGTGSAVAEQLVRLGVRDFIIVDKDLFDKTNVTRLFGSKWSDVRTKRKRAKVQIVKEHLNELCPDAQIAAIESDVLKQEVLKELSNCELLFSCTDRHTPRSVLNEIAYQYFIPLVDVGVGIDAKDGIVNGGGVRATIVYPGLPCLFCYSIIRSDVIAAELLPEKERIARQREGYVPGIIGEAPSVVHLTSMAASLGITLAMDHLFGLSENTPANLIFDLSDYTIQRLTAKPHSDCVCKHRMGRGSYYPLSAPG